MKQIFEALGETASRYPASIALASRTGYMTYEDFVGNLSSAAHAMAKSGVRAGQLIVLTGANADAQIILALALFRLGCRVGFSAGVELYDTSGVEVDAVVADAQRADPKHRVIVIGRDWFLGAKGRELGLPEPAEDYSIIFASSGSTGLPKLVEYGREALLHRVYASAWKLYRGGVPRLLSALGSRTAAYFCNGLFYLLQGGLVIGVTARDGRTVLETIQLFRPNFVIMPPSTVAEMLSVMAERKMDFEKVPTLLAPGAKCSPELQRAALDSIAEDFITFYGSTETGGIARGSSADVLKIDGCVGKVVEGVEIATFDADGSKLATGIEGEIRVRIPPNRIGHYIGTGAGEAAAFKEGWFSTGDIGLVDDDRNLIIRGRATNVINIGGSKVSPELLEEGIRSFSQVRDVGVAGVERSEGFEEICAAIVSNTKLTVDDVNAHLRRRNSRWGVHSVKLVPAIPRTASGKIDRGALKRLCSEAT